MPHTISLAGIPTFPPEKLASVAIIPGYLLADGTGGDAGKLKPHATADGNAAPYFALESLIPTNSATQAIDLSYAIGDSVRWAVGAKGDLFYAWVPANAAAIVEGDDLVSDGTGCLKKATAATAGTVGNSSSIVAKAAEAINNSAVASPARLRVRIV